MDKTLQTTVWNCLPKEFKEEVKRMWSVEVDCATKYKSELHKHRTDLLYELFGEHLHWQNNLTSDAEGEGEMLYVKASVVKDIYGSMNKAHPKENAWVVKQTLEALFGSKCLPDVSSSVPSTKSNVPSSEPKPAEPKFSKGDMVHCKSFGYEGDYKVLEYTGGPRNCYDCIDKYGSYYRFYESDLEPYTEPSKEDSECLHAESVKESRIASEESHLRNLSQSMSNCNKSDEGFPHDARRCGTVYHRRKMDMAAMIAAGILAGSDFMANDCTKEAFDKLAEVSLACAESIISKTLRNGED